MFLPLPARWKRSDGAEKAPRSIFDIVYPTTPNGSRPPDVLPAPRNRPVNFLYMGLFLGIEKT
jgi:hypothetical protein